jgi:hypothetical protein
MNRARHSIETGVRLLGAGAALTGVLALSAACTEAQPTTGGSSPALSAPETGRQPIDPDDFRTWPEGTVADDIATCKDGVVRRVFLGDYRLYGRDAVLRNDPTQWNVPSIPKKKDLAKSHLYDGAWAEVTVYETDQSHVARAAEDAHAIGTLVHNRTGLSVTAEEGALGPVPEDIPMGPELVWTADVQIARISSCPEPTLVDPASRV